MVAVSKIDSNITGLVYAKEAEIGYLPGENGNPGTPVWYRLNPNSYSDFGGEVVTATPSPINDSRQRRKGVLTDINASGGINHNLSFTSLTDLMQGVMFAAIRKKANVLVSAIDLDTVNPDLYDVAATAGFMVGGLIKGHNFLTVANNALNVVTVVATDVSIAVADGQLVAETPPATAYIQLVGFQFVDADAEIDATGSLPVLVSNGTLVDFTTFGLVPGQWIFLGGDATINDWTNAANTGFKRIRGVTATEITFDKSDSAMVSEVAASGKFIRMFFGDVLRNESGVDISRSSYQIERSLGQPDTGSSATQSELLKGAVPNELTINIPQAELANVDIAFMAIDDEKRTSVQGLKQTSVLSFPVSSEYNTSSDISRLRMGIVSDVNEAQDALFAYVTEATISITNNITPNKAVGTLGSFDLSAGTFQVSGNVTAYFATVEATSAVRNNSDVTFDISFVKDNTAMIFDLPLVSLGDGRLSVELDQPITLPLVTEAASGEDIDPNLDHTLLITYFSYVPNIA
jgi:hypothetical protein